MARSWTRQTDMVMTMTFGGFFMVSVELLPCLHACYASVLLRELHVDIMTMRAEFDGSNNHNFPFLVSISFSTYRSVA